LGAIACLALLAAGCGSSEESEPSAARTTPPTEPRPRAANPPPDADRASSWGVIGAQGNEERTPIEELYGVFSKSAAVAPATLRQLRNLAGGSCGEVDEGRARVLLPEVGSPRYTLAAAPTSTGSVVYGLLPDGSGHCGLPLAGGLFLAGETTSRGALHYGLVPDDVEFVEVVFKGEAHRARVSNNGFAVEVKGADEGDHGRVVIHRRDGTTERF
jgi:hypothetical protein